MNRNKSVTHIPKSPCDKKVLLAVVDVSKQVCYTHPQKSVCVHYTHPQKSVGMCVMKREINRILMYECRCDERLKDKPERSTRLVYTGFRGGLEHLKIETRLIDERFPSVMGECVI